MQSISIPLQHRHYLHISHVKNSKQHQSTLLNPYTVGNIFNFSKICIYNILLLHEIAVIALRQVILGYKAM